MKELDSGYQIIEGQINILVVASHNFDHGRDGKIKLADLGTGDLVRKLCQKYNFWGIVSTRNQLDPNWYIYSSFRQKVKEIIKNNDILLVIDIHGKSLSSPCLVELKGNNKFKERYSINVNDFVNNQQQTLAEELDKIVPVLQIEIREDGRVDTINPIKFSQTQKTITNLIDKIVND